MFGSGVLEIGIGMILIFLSVSLICSAAREALETVMRTRSKDLERGLRELLHDPDGLKIVKDLFDHPMISGLFGGTYDPAKLKPTLGVGGAGRGRAMPFRARRQLPSYIPSGQFASALLDLVVRGSAATGGAPAGAPPVLSVESLRESAGKLPNEQVRRAILSAIDYADGNIEAVKANIETWFNGTMDRVSGWYKRRTQIILFAIGLLAALILNVDAITIAKRLHDDDNLRQALVAEAEAVVKAGSNEAGSPNALSGKSITDLRKELSLIGVPIGWRGWVPGPQTETIAKCATGKPEKAAKAGTGGGSKTGKTADAGKGKANPSWSACVKQLGVGGVAQIAIGWLIIAFGVMLGAPFWFDILSKFMVVRSTVKTPETAPKVPDSAAKPQEKVQK